jgi:predicted CXXCH cytochrome family protein
MDDCENCHAPVKAGVQPVFDVAEEELCASCHEEVGADAKHPHPPVEAGECLACHNPHRSHQPALLRKKGKALCAECHDFEPEQVSVSAHPPFSDGECARCHDSHGAEHPGLQTDALPEKCYQCHRQMSSSVAAATTVHPPVEEGACDLCHEPHTSRFKNLQKAGTMDLCGECHDLEPAGPSVHSPFEGGVCVACHNVHAGESSLMRWTDEECCLRCHEDMIEVVNSENVHPPVAEDCRSCHVAHSSEYGPLLRQSQHQLCAECHGDVEVDVTDHPEVGSELCSECHDPHEL